MPRKVPLSIAKYMRTLWMSEMVVTYFLIDHEGNLVNWSGYPRYYGLVNLTTGQPATEQLVFLEGLLPVTYTEVLHFVEINPEGSVAHVHLIPSQKGTWVLLLDAQVEREHQQKMQQRYNELSLLHYRQSQLIQKLEEARSTLLDEKKQLETTIDLKSRFISNLSHELRAPLSSIIGYTELINKIEQTDQKETTYLNTVKKNASHLLTLVDNILDETKLEMGKITLQLEPCYLLEFINDLKQLFFPIIHEKALAFEIEATARLPEKVIIDELRFRQILINLINNAIKFTQQGSIKLRLDWENDALYFAVTDTGIGISPEAQTKVFTAFHQETNSQSGAGLGLAISAHLVNLMEGKLAVESELGVGSTFSGYIKANTGYSLPYEDNQIATLPEIEPYKIMIVDDDTIIRMLLEAYLKEGGYEIIRAIDGEEAVKLTIQERPDLIFMDVNMPNMSGYEAVKTLRSQQITIPIIALSASNFEHDRLHAIQSGYDDYLTKPVHIDKLFDILQQYLGQHNISYTSYIV